MKKRTVEISILETVTDKEFERILSVFSIVEGVCRVCEVKPTNEKIKNEFFNGEQISVG